MSHPVKSPRADERVRRPREYKSCGRTYYSGGSSVPIPRKLSAMGKESGEKVGEREGTASERKEGPVTIQKRQAISEDSCTRQGPGHLPEGAALQETGQHRKGNATEERGDRRKAGGKLSPPRLYGKGSNSAGGGGGGVDSLSILGVTPSCPDNSTRRSTCHKKGGKKIRERDWEIIRRKIWCTPFRLVAGPSGRGKRSLIVVQRDRLVG